MKVLIGQFIRFFGLSGLGWCIDFSLYLIFTLVFDWPVFYSNCLSSIPAITLVFFVSTKKIFKNSEQRIPLGIKYAIYVCYQMILLTMVSILGQYLALWIGNLAKELVLIEKVSKILVKIIITPITMVMNFFVMKIMAERI